MSRRSPLVVLAVLAVLGTALLASDPIAAKKKKKKKAQDAAELFNPLLGIDYSHWLVGPLAEIASEDEVAGYLALTDDAAAEAFIDAFWSRRAEGLGFFDKTPQQIFATRAEEADKRFTEAAFPGRRTDRGRILILYGEPDEIVFESAARRFSEPLEVWTYAKDAAVGLDGESPSRRYQFQKQGELTQLYYGAAERRRKPIRSDRPRDGR